MRIPRYPLAAPRAFLWGSGEPRQKPFPFFFGGRHYVPVVSEVAYRAAIALALTRGSATWSPTGRRLDRDPALPSLLELDGAGRRQTAQESAEAPQWAELPGGDSFSDLEARVSHLWGLGVAAHGLAVAPVPPVRPSLSVITGAGRRQRVQEPAEVPRCAEIPGVVRYDSSLHSDSDLAEMAPSVRDWVSQARARHPAPARLVLRQRVAFPDDGPEEKRALLAALYGLRPVAIIEGESS